MPNYSNLENGRNETGKPLRTNVILDSGKWLSEDNKVIALRDWVARQLFFHSS